MIKDAKCSFIDVRDKQGKLLFKFNPEKMMIEIKPKGGRVTIVYLKTDRTAPKVVNIN